MMEWYLGHEVGDLFVPKDQEYFDRLPSPDSWSQWGSLASYEWPNNLDFGYKITNLLDEKPQQRMSFGRGDKDMNQPTEGQPPYDDSSSFRGSSKDSHSFCGNSAARVRPDYYFDNLTGTNPTDDIFLNSLLQDDVPASVHNHSPVAIPPQARCNAMQASSDPTSRMLDFQSVSCDTDGVRSFKCFRTPPFSPSDGSDNGHASMLKLSQGNSSDQSNGSSVKVLETTDIVPCDQEASRGTEAEDSLIEESVLMGLEAVLSQFSDKTRLCFRDSFYRLAERSEQQVSTDAQLNNLASGNPSLSETVDGNLRSKTETAESKTNTIDRAVANLLFNKVDANVHDLLPTISAKFGHVDEDEFAATVAKNCDSNDEAKTFLIPSRPPAVLAHCEAPAVFWC